MDYDQLVNNNVMKTAPLVFVTLGSILIVLRVRASQHQCLKMTSSVAITGRSGASMSFRTTTTVKDI